MRLAVNGQQLAETHTLPDLLKHVRKLNIDAVELWPHNLPGGTTAEEKERWETKDVTAAAQALRKHDMQVACVTLGFDAFPMILENGTVADATTALKGTIDAAAALDAKLVNCYLAGTPRSIFLDVARPAAEYARDRDVTIVLENEAHDDSAMAEGMLHILEAVAAPNFKTLYDPCNYYQAGEEPYPAAWEAIGGHVGYVHFKGGGIYREDAALHRGGTLRGFTDTFIGYGPLSESDFDVEAIVRRLKTDGYDGFATFEPHVPAEHVETLLAADVAYLRELLETEPS